MKKEKMTRKEKLEERKTLTYTAILLALLVIVVIFFIGVFFKIKREELRRDNAAVFEEDVVITFDNTFGALKDNYEFKYEISVGNNFYTYIGKKMGDKEKGTKSLWSDEKAYSIENNVGYIEENGEKVESNIYEGIDTSYLDIENIKNLITSLKPVKTENSHTYIFVDKTIVITYQEDFVNILITIGNDSYNLTYTKINSIKNL